MRYNLIAERRERMDQIKTGRFISQERKSRNLTQKQLAEKLNISDKTISKWECGKGFPEISLILPLCDILQTSVNELLLGERVSEEEYRKKAEENILNLVKEKAESKKKIIISIINGFTGISVLLVCILLAGYLTNVSTALKIFLVLFGVIIFLILLALAIVFDCEAGAFECPKCHKRFIPNYKSYLMGTHTITKRKLKCPECGKTSYCKHALTK